MDGDDRCRFDRFEKELNILRLHPDISIVSSDMEFFDNTGIWGKISHPAEPKTKDFVRESPFCHAACMVRREAYNIVGGYTVANRLMRVEDYADINRYIMMHEMMLKRGAVTILWGCSVEPDIVKRPEVSYDLAKYSLITARESISYNALRRVNENTMLLPDPAFLLESVPLKPTAGYDIKNMVGINLSPMVMENESIQGITIANYQNTIEYILDETDMGIALIPHVVWQEGDDRIPLRLLYDKYKKSGRIMFVEDHNCMELKGIIAQCRFFIGARTHATIAAYSSGIPTLVVGYSVKARGIAKDLFGKEDGYVIPVQLLKHEDDIKTELKKIIGRENEIRKALKKQKKYVEMYRKE